MMLCPRVDSNPLHTVRIIGLKAYCYLDGVPCFHRGSHEKLLEENGISKTSVIWALSNDEMSRVKKHCS